jgi:hypothetical protein
MDDAALRNLLGGIRKTLYEDGLGISLNASLGNDGWGRRPLP